MLLRINTYLRSKSHCNSIKKDVASFKLRKGSPIKVTLRGERMYEFLDRLITIALPRVRDFQGINPKGFDERKLQSWN